jgi:hypothetical protein
MNTSVLASTFLLTLLLLVGLVFFIRASVKARVQTVQLISEQPEAATLTQIEDYFAQRAYQVTAVDEAQQQIQFEGLVRPSVFLALFLSGLAAIGGLSLALVLAILFPQLARLSLSLVLFAPIAGIFYWQRSGRTEKVILKVQPPMLASETDQSLITVIGHRDELATLQRSLSLKAADLEAIAPNNH